MAELFKLYNNNCVCCCFLTCCFSSKLRMTSFTEADEAISLMLAADVRKGLNVADEEVMSGVSVCD